MSTKMLLRTAGFVSALALSAGAYAQNKDALNVVASFSILGDWVQQVGGDAVNTTVLVGAGADAHVYAPTPADARALSKADLLVVNGLDFEGWLPRLVEAANFEGQTLIATTGITPLAFDEHDEHDDEDHHDEHDDEDHHDEHDDEDHHDEHDDEDHHDEHDDEDHHDEHGDEEHHDEHDDEDHHDEHDDEDHHDEHDDEDHHDEHDDEDHHDEHDDEDHHDEHDDEDHHDEHGDEEHHDEHGDDDHHDEHGDDDHHDEHGDDDHHDEHGDEDHHDEHGDEDHHGHNHGAYDPHAWQSLELAQVYVANIADALSAADPENASVYAANAASYTEQLSLWHATLSAQFAALDADHRTVVTSHDAFGYFEDAYGVEFLAPQGLSTESEASAQDVANIIRQIRSQGIKAVFVENISDPRLIRQIANETGAQVGGTLYSDSLSRENGPAATYLDMVRYNAEQILAALQ